MSLVAPAQMCPSGSTTTDFVLVVPESIANT
jgi:hypothetical protein